MDQSIASGISVIIPCFNVKDYVRRAVSSAASQTAPPKEIICVDDGSTDGTLGVLRELEKEYAGLVRVYTGSNKGAPAARNWGLKEAQGDFVQFLDADDELDRGKLEAQIAIMQREGVDLVVGGYRRQMPDGEVSIRPPNPGPPWVRLFQSRLGNTCANLWRRSKVTVAGGWSESLASSQEVELMARMLREGASVAFDPEPRITVHARPGSIGFDFDGPVRERHARVRVEALDWARAALKDGDLAEAEVAVFRSLRLLYPFDPDAAVRLHRQAFPGGLKLRPSAANTRSYVAVYRTLGFYWAERLRSLRFP